MSKSFDFLQDIRLIDHSLSNVLQLTDIDAFFMSFDYSYVFIGEFINELKPTGQFKAPFPDCCERGER